MLARAGKICGSELKNLITDKGKIRAWTTEMPQSYLHKKLAEKWLGQPLQSFQGNQQTDQGKLWEPKARSYFSSLLECDIQTIGGIESDDARLWCSPDGVIDGDTGLEIKVPNANNQIAWILAGPGVPEEHVLQVQFSLLVSGWERWKFLSWSNNLPHLVVTVEPDEALISTIEEAVSDFNIRMDAGFARLVELNGGPPPPRKPFVSSSEVDPSTELFQGLQDPDDFKM
jgi:YqaJ-like viral recombinase domain